MNQDTVKTLLESLQACEKKFSVTFTGKKSGKVNGLYKPDTCEILLHNKNFKSDNELLYTAIHEYAHHLVCCNTGSPAGSKSHTTYFWATFHELLQTAESSGLYSLVSLTAAAQGEFEQLVAFAKKIDASIAQNERELSLTLNRLHHFCKENKVRYEDVLDRKMNISRTHAKKLAKVVEISDIDSGLSTDQKTFLLTLGRIDKRQEAMLSFENGKTIDQVKLAVKKQDTAVEQKGADEKLHELEKQKGKLEQAIEKMKTQIRNIFTEIQNLRRL